MRAKPIRAMTLVSLAAFVGCKQPGEPAATTVGSVPVITVHASDFAFLAPDTILSGVTTFRFVNDGPSLHQLALVRLGSGKTMSDLLHALSHRGEYPPWGVFVGGPNGAGAHEESNATLEVPPGSYVMVCLVHLPTGMTHIALGMLHALTVRPATRPARALPTPDITVTLSDYTFTLSRPLTAGRRTFLVRVLPGQPHELELVKLESGKTSADLVAWIANPQGPPPGNPIGGAAPMGAGSDVYFTADVSPGSYALLCFVDDANDGRPHVTHGMVRTVRVK